MFLKTLLKHNLVWETKEKMLRFAPCHLFLTIKLVSRSHWKMAKLVSIFVCFMNSIVFAIFKLAIFATGLFFFIF